MNNDTQLLLGGQLYFANERVDCLCSDWSNQTSITAKQPNFFDRFSLM